MFVTTIQFAFRPSGMMFAVGPEQPVHVCATTTKPDELELLRDIAAAYEV